MRMSKTAKQPKTNVPPILHAVAASPRPRFDNPPRINGSVLVLPDVELPFHNAPFLNNVIMLARAQGVRQLILDGDFMHNASFAYFAGSEKEADQELSEVEELVYPFFANFDAVYWLSGNHDTRIQKMLDRLISMERIARMIVPPEHAAEFYRKVKIFDHFWCKVGSEWQIHHPNVKGAQIPARTATWIAEKNDCNVGQGHVHLFGTAQTRNGKWMGIDIGVGVDVRRLAYQNLRHSTHPNGVAGALILRERDGKYYPQHVSQRFTDFEYELWLWQNARQFAEKQGRKEN